MSAATVSQGRIRAARAWFGGIAVVIAAALIIQIILIINGGADANSGESGTTVSLPIRFVRLFSYFTIESNIVVLVISVLLAANPLRTGRLWEVARLNALLAITITGLVYDIILAPLVHLTGWALAATIGFHYIAPWATVLGWLIFGPRPRLKWWMIPAAFILPIAWLIYIFTQGVFTQWYPYPFLNVTNLGFWPALLNSLLVVAVGAVLGVIYKLIDWKLPALLRDRSHR